MKIFTGNQEKIPHMPSSFEFIKLKIIGIIVNESKAEPKAIIILTPF